MVSSADLPQAGDPGHHFESAMMPRLVEFGFIGQGGARTYEAHVSPDHVENLRKLVEAEAPEDSPERRDPVVRRELVQRGAIARGCRRVLAYPLPDVVAMRAVAGRRAHRSKLQHPEVPPVNSDPHLFEKNRTPIEYADCQCGESHHRSEHHKQKA